MTIKQIVRVRGRCRRERGQPRSLCDVAPKAESVERQVVRRQGEAGEAKRRDEKPTTLINHTRRGFDHSIGGRVRTQATIASRSASIMRLKYA